MGDIVGILLAAGSGSRFGGDKLLHPLADGTPMGVAAARSLRAALDRVVAVTRPGDDKLADLLAKAGCEVIVAHDAALGMGHSLAAGVRAAPDAGGWMIALGDMPCIKPETHRLISQALQAGGSIVAPVCNGVRGHPVAFAAGWYAELSALRGDAGAKALLQTTPLQLTRLAVEDAGIVKDVDFAAPLWPGPVGEGSDSARRDGYPVTVGSIASSADRQSTSTYGDSSASAVPPSTGQG